MRIRPFEDRDYEDFININNRTWPELAGSVDALRHEDSTWSDPKFYRARWMIEDECRVVGIAEMRHSRGHFQPESYACTLMIDPEARGRGYGTALFDHLVSIGRSRGARALRGATKASCPDALEFLRSRGCTERKRNWESRLQLRRFDFVAFRSAEPRVRGQGVTITTLAAELRQADRGIVLRKLFALHEAVRRDIPADDPATDLTYETYVEEISGPTVLPDALFLAVKDGEYLGLSQLWKNPQNPEVIHQGLTGVHPAHRGKGIAMALKLRAVRYAIGHGIKTISTWNDVRNRPMLRINEALGFMKQPVWIEFEKKL